MRRLMLIANPTVALFFVAFFVTTFFGRRHIDHLARDFVTAETLKFAAPAVDLAEETFKTPIVRRLLTKDQIAAFELEFADYRRNPTDYIAELTGRRAPAGLQQFKNPVLAKVMQWKQNVRDHYNNILERLFIDLRIFAGSNVVAAVIATWLAFRANRKTTRKCALLSFLLLAAVVYSVSVYVDRLTFFTILFNSYLGWWYPVLMVVTFLGLFLDYRRSFEGAP